MRKASYDCRSIFISMTETDRKHFAEHGYVVFEDLFEAEELHSFVEWFDRDRRESNWRWHSYGHHQTVNYDVLVTTLQFDRVIRHPKIMAAVEALMGGPTCFGEIRRAAHGALRRGAAPRVAPR